MTVLDDLEQYVYVVGEVQSLLTEMEANLGPRGAGVTSHQVYLLGIFLPLIQQCVARITNDHHLGSFGCQQFGYMSARRVSSWMSRLTGIMVGPNFMQLIAEIRDCLSGPTKDDIVNIMTALRRRDASCEFERQLLFHRYKKLIPTMGPSFFSERWWHLCRTIWGYLSYSQMDTMPGITNDQVYSLLMELDLFTWIVQLKPPSCNFPCEARCDPSAFRGLLEEMRYFVPFTPIISPSLRAFLFKCVYHLYH